MGQMKDFLITVHNGGDEAVAAVRRVSEDWRAQLEQAADEIERLRLTDDERQAIKWIVGDDLSADGVSIQATLRGLLARHGTTGSE